MRVATLALILPAVPLALPMAVDSSPALPLVASSGLATQEAEASDAAVQEAAPLNGTFVPAEFAEVELWLEEYAGELLLLEVLAHGTYVNEGDVIARLDSERIDEGIVDAHLALAAAERSHHATAVRAELSEAGAKADRADRERELERTRREHATYLEKEVAFQRRQSELMAAGTADRIEDMALELATLEAMYADDELIDATEEIVIQRSRRDLARSRASQALAEERRKLQLEQTLEHELARREERMAKAERGHVQFLQEQELADAERAAGLEASARSLAKTKARLEGLKRDREAFEVRAPRAGVLLHGSAKAQAGGRSDHARGGRAAARTPLFTVAHPDRLAVTLEVDAATQRAVGEGGAVEVAVPGTDREIVGRMRVERYPTAASVGRGAAAFAATVELTGPLPGVVVGLPAEVHLARSVADEPHANAGGGTAAGAGGTR